MNIINHSFQKRIFLTLTEDNEETVVVKSILKSPLELAQKLIILLFEGNLKEIKNELDEIKYFAGGIYSAENIAKTTGYSLAKYYPNMFAFHQYFQSSYRARQGKVLEKILIHILSEYTECDVVPNTSQKMLKIVSESFQYNFPNLDIDCLGYDSKNHNIILIQLRSRDDTGGTTAKGSLVELLKEMIRTHRKPSDEILYLVSVWDARNSQQKTSTICKIYSSIEDLIDIDEVVFKNNIAKKGIKIRNKINLRMVYGVQEISNAIYDWSIKKENNIFKSISNIISLIENWDDLWIAYENSKRGQVSTFDITSFWDWN